MNKPLIYLACPYSHSDPQVRIERFESANRAAAYLMCQGHKVFSPISHTHPIAVSPEGELPKGWEFWHEFDRAFLEYSYKIIVLCIDGWKESVGVQGELKIAEELGLEVEYMLICEDGYYEYLELVELE